MERTGRWPAGFCALAAFLGAGAACATPWEGAAQSQSAPPPQLIPRSHQERENRYRTLHRVVLDVEVRDAAGNPVTGLKGEDFTLLEDRKPRAFDSFRPIEGAAINAPPQVVLMLDAVNNSARDLGRDSKGVESFLRNGRGLLEFPTMIGVLTEGGIRTATPSRKREFVLGQLKELTEGLRPISCAGDASPNEAFLAVWMPGMASSPESMGELNCLDRRFIVSLTALQKFADQGADLPGRIILVWIGPGWPKLYNKQFREDNDRLKGNFFQSLVQISNALREGQVTLDMLMPPDLLRRAELLNDHDRSFFDGVPKQNEVTAGSLSLDALAHQSGGQLLVSRKAISAGVAACIDDAKWFYELAFDAPPAAAFGEYHALAVVVDRPGMTVRTRTVYYAEQ